MIIIYYSLIRHEIFPDEQKVYCKRTRGTEDLLYIDQHINESKMRLKNLSMAWIDYKKSLRYGPTKLDTRMS